MLSSNLVISNICNFILMSTTPKVFFDDENFRELKSFLQNNKDNYSSYFILTDSNVHSHCLASVLTKIEEFKELEILEIEPGESQKSIEIAAQLWDTLLEMKADKKALMINIGGGVITDIGGFIAGTYKRGIDYINLPRSLLGAVDAAIGGKTGLDFNGLKNQIGVMYNSQGVFVNPVFFDSLPDDEFYSGLAECIKHMLIALPELWNTFLTWEKSHREFVVEFLPAMVQVKVDIVTKDPYEKNERQYLNYGHTIGHALESHSINCGIEIKHGVAVAWGIIAENMLAKDLGYLDASTNDTIANCIKKSFVFQPVPQDFVEPMIEICTHDKKNENGEIRFSFLQAPGKIVAKQKASVEQIKTAIANTVAFLAND